MCLSVRPVNMRAPVSGAQKILRHVDDNASLARPLTQLCTHRKIVSYKLFAQVCKQGVSLPLVHHTSCSTQTVCRTRELLIVF